MFLISNINRVKFENTTLYLHHPFYCNHWNQIQILHTKYCLVELLFFTFEFTDSFQRKYVSIIEKYIHCEIYLYITLTWVTIEYYVHIAKIITARVEEVNDLRVEISLVGMHRSAARILHVSLNFRHIREIVWPIN